MQRSAYVLGSQLVVTAFCVSACETSTGQLGEGEIASTQQAIINGTPVNPDVVGTPYLFNAQSSNKCSSTLLRDRWLITARHCVNIDGFDSPPLADPTNLRACVGHNDCVDQTKVENVVRAAGIESWGGPDFDGNGSFADVGIVKLGASLPAPIGHVQPFETLLYRGSSTALEGNTYYCQGWGYGSCSTQDVALRSAFLEVDDAQSGGYTMAPNTLGQLQRPGDSGSSCVDVVNGRYRILGTHSAGAIECGTQAFELGMDAVRDWVDSIIDRVAMIDVEAGSTLRIKEGGLDHAWVAEYPGVTAAAIAGPRVAALGSDGHCRVKEGDFSNAWVDLWTPGGVTQCLLAGSRIGILTSDGVFRVKEGSLSSAFVTQSSSVTQATLSLDRIGVRTSNGNFSVKEGSLTASLVFQASNVTQGMVSGNRIGIVTTAGALRVKEGSLSAPFFTLRSNVQQGALSGDRIGALSAGHFFVKEGGLFATWVDVEDNVAQGTLSGKRIGVIVNENPGAFPAFRYRVKEGALTADWVVQQQAAAVPHVAVPLVKADPVTASTGARACAGLCNNPTQITISGSYSNPQLGTGAVCIETTSPVHGGNCGNLVSPRVLKVNGTTMTCNNQNWPTIPPALNDGYCIQTTPGQHPYAFVTLW